MSTTITGLRARMPFHPAPNERYVRTPEFRLGRNFIREHDACQVKGIGLCGFIAHVRDTETGNEYLEVVGPVRNPRVRSVPAERVTRKRGKVYRLQGVLVFDRTA